MPYTVYSVRYEEVDVPVSARDDRRADQARQRLVEFLNEGGHVLPGSLVERRTRCGKANCRCHAEPPELHGPYLQWSYTLQNKRFTRWFTPSRRSATGHGSKQPAGYANSSPNSSGWKSSARACRRMGDVKRSPDVRKGSHMAKSATKPRARDLRRDNFTRRWARVVSPLGPRWHRQLLRSCWEAHSSGRASLWTDEAATWVSSTQPVSNIIANSSHVDVIFLPYYLFMHFWLGASQSLWWMRLPSLVTGAGAVAALGLLARRWLHR